MACEPEQFDGVTADIFNCLKVKLRQAGYSIENTSGTLKGPFGIIIDYSWDEEANSLRIHVKDKSMFISCEQISTILLNNLYECGLDKV